MNFLGLSFRDPAPSQGVRPHAAVAGYVHLRGAAAMGAPNLLLTSYQRDLPDLATTGATPDYDRINHLILLEVDTIETVCAIG